MDRVDAQTGKTLARRFTHGAGVIYKKKGDPAARSSPVPHGITIWNGDLWYCDDIGVVCRMRLRG